MLSAERWSYRSQQTSERVEVLKVSGLMCLRARRLTGWGGGDGLSSRCWKAFHLRTAFLPKVIKSCVIVVGGWDRSSLRLSLASWHTLPLAGVKLCQLGTQESRAETYRNLTLMPFHQTQQPLFEIQALEIHTLPGRTKQLASGARERFASFKQSAWCEAWPAGMALHDLNASAQTRSAPPLARTELVSSLNRIQGSWRKPAFFCCSLVQKLSVLCGERVRAVPASFPRQAFGSAQDAQLWQTLPKRRKAIWPGEAVCFASQPRPRPRPRRTGVEPAWTETNPSPRCVSVGADLSQLSGLQCTHQSLPQPTLI